ncbi:MAG TPA: penicillin-binding transpeptidase domain-containing protein [Mycobacteriales bacterium]|nr:penicillin-binding transpeptidase domain-containing protein [Mycobacteriales bacterium]
MTDRSRLRLVVLGVLVVSLVATLLGRLWYLQVLNAHAYGVAAQHNQTRDIVTQPPRGEVLDDTGRPLIDNKTALVVSVDRTALQRQPDGGVAVLHRLSKLLHVPYKLLSHEIQQCGLASSGKTITRPCWAGSPYQPIPVSQLKPSVAATMKAIQIKELSEEYPGVSAQLQPVRNYPEPEGAQAATILGYTQQIGQTQLAKLSKAQQTIQLGTEVGAAGIEESYQKYLRGTPGLKQITVDALGAQTGVTKNTQPIAGDDVVTNIDAKAQADLETELQNAITTARNHGFTADYDAGVVMNVRTGGIVAMGSNPSYSPRKPPSSYSSQAKYLQAEHKEGFPFLDKAFGTTNPPGSTFKMISSSGLLGDGTMSTGGLYDCPTTFQKRTSFEKVPGLGSITLAHALIVSCDTFFFKLGWQDWHNDQTLIKEGKKPKQGVQALAHDYGLGENPDLDIPGAAAGHIADRENTKLLWEANKKNYCEGAARRPKGSYLQRLDAQDCKIGYIFLPGDQENEDVGQGTVDVSPLQLAVAYSALANGGTVFKPRVAKAILSPSGKLIRRIKAPVRDHIPLSQGDQDYIRNALYGVTTSTNPMGTGTSVFANFPMGQVKVGGKTGTAELSGTQENGSWFASFGGPAGQAPQYVTVIEVDKSDQGAISAAPFVKKMWDDLYGLQGAKAALPNGVPPTLHTAIAAAVVAAAGGAKAGHPHHAGKSGSGKHSSGKGTSPPPSSPSSPTSSAGGLPPGLPAIPRREPSE